MEETSLRNYVQLCLKDKIGGQAVISDSEWEAAKADAFRDIYHNRLCGLMPVKIDYFVNVLVDLIAISKRIDKELTC